MSADKKIQIPMSMFLDVYSLIDSLRDYELDIYTRRYIKRIGEAINAKFDAMERRDVYTQSKVAPTGIEREGARQKYLDLAGIHKDFRYGRDFIENNYR